MGEHTPVINANLYVCDSYKTLTHDSDIFLTGNCQANRQHEITPKKGGMRSVLKARMIKSVFTQVMYCDTTAAIYLSVG